jgi:activator of HSP90 ATPase
MARVIQQSVILKAPPEALFDSFLDSKRHTALTGGMPAKVSRRPGGVFTAFGGQIRGRNLLILPKRMIVQAWRSDHWKPGDADSILILCFAKARGGGRIDLTHVNVPSHDLRGVMAGWPKYYWQPWKAYLARG